jgi:hypothetical protein
MNFKLALTNLATISIVLSTHAQGTFQNLDFESANPGTTFSSGVPVSSALPDWTATVSGVQQTQIPVNDPSLGAAQVMLASTGGPIAPIDGSYSAFLTGNYNTTTSISQAGLIPVGTQSLFFDAQKGFGGGGDGNLGVFIGTQDVPFTPVATYPNYTLYGANISAWSGDTEELTFSALASSMTGLNNWTLDDISFSPAAIPEPSAMALTGIAGVLFALYRRFAPKGQ